MARRKAEEEEANFEFKLLESHRPSTTKEGCPSHLSIGTEAANHMSDRLMGLSLLSVDSQGD